MDPLSPCQMMSFAVLPHRGSQWLCRVGGGAVEPLVAAPGGRGARHVIADDAAALAVLTKDRRQAGLFTIQASEPWLVEQLPIAELPPECEGHTVAAVEGTLLVGGHARNGEALWSRHGAGPVPWVEIPLPEFVRQYGKAVDGLLRSGDKLIVIDNIVLPKWVLEYDILGGGQFGLVRTVELPFHTSYENVYQAAIGEPGIVLLSHGMNHGTVSSHVWMLAKESLVEIRHVCGRAGGWLEMMGVKPRGRAKVILEARDAAFVGGMLAVACGRRGMIVADVSSLPTRSARHGPAGIPFRRLRLPEVGSVRRLEVPRPVAGDGLFAVGKTREGEWKVEWVSRERLATAAQKRGEESP